MLVQDPGHLERLTGLDKMHASAVAAEEARSAAHVPTEATGDGDDDEWLEL